MMYRILLCFLVMNGIGASTATAQRPTVVRPPFPTASQAPTHDICVLLLKPEAEKALEVGSSELKEFRTFFSPLFNEAPAIVEISPAPRQKQNEMLARIVKKMEERDDELYRMTQRLLDPDQWDSLLGAYLIVKGDSGWLNLRVMESLHLRETQKEEIKKIVEDFRISKRQVFSKILKKESLTSQELSLKGDAIDTLILKVLDESQKTELRKVQLLGLRLVEKMQYQGTLTTGW